MALLIKSDGTKENIDVPVKDRLQFLQKIVGGYIEMVQTVTGKVLIIDEEGKLKGKEVNEDASKLYINGKEDPIVGNVLICEEYEINDYEN